MNSLPLSVYAQDRERHDLPDLVQCREHPFAGLVGHGVVLGPSGRNIGDGQCVGVLTCGEPALGVDQVDLDEPGLAAPAAP
jgi:hypothetical protein